MDIAIWVAISIALIYATAPITQGVRKLDEKQLRKYVTRRGLPLPASLREPLMRRISATEKLAVGAGCIGLGVGAVLAFVLERISPDDMSWGALAMGGATVGGALGGYLSSRRQARALLPEAPRVARATATSLDDYLAPGERMAFARVPWVVLVGIAAAWFFWALLPQRSEGHWLLMGVATVVPVLLLASWALVAVAGRRLLDTPQHATTDLELAWDDATRTDALRGLGDIGVSVGLVGPLVSLIVIANQVLGLGPVDARVWLGGAALLTGLVLWGVVLVPYLGGRSTKNPSLGLWRGVAFTGGQA